MSNLNQTYERSTDERYFAEMDAAFAGWCGPRERLILDPLGLAEDQRRAVNSMVRSAFTSGARFAAERAVLRLAKIRAALNEV